MQGTLWVVNDKGVEERVAEVCLSQSMPGSGSGKLLVATYSREPSVLHADSTYERRTLTPAGQGEASGEVNSKKLLSFAGYLRERNKAAVIRYEGHEYYILPSQSATSELQLLRQPGSSSRPQAASTGSSSATATSQPKAPAPGSGQHQLKPPVAAPPPPPKSSLLQALSSRLIDSNAESRKIAAANEKAKIATVVDYFKDLEVKIRAQLDAFAEDPELNELRLDPMDKDERYVVHDVITDYPDLLSTAVGDYDERHVVVYRKGFQPQGVDLSALHPSEYMRKSVTKRKSGIDVTHSKNLVPVASHAAAAAAAAAAGVAGADGTAPGAIVGAGNVILTTTKVGLVKRDRRTTEEVELEIKRRKGIA